jgi:hypothetical protein
MAKPLLPLLSERTSQRAVSLLGWGGAILLGAGLWALILGWI